MLSGGFLLPLSAIIVFYILICFLLRSNKMFKRFNSKNQNKRSVNKTVHYLNKNECCELTNKLTVPSKINRNNMNDDYIAALNTLNKNLFIKNNSIYHLDGQKTSNNSVLKREKKLIKTTILIVTSFCIAWGPYAVIVLLAQFGTNIKTYITPLSTSLPSLFAKTSSVFNPIIYTLTNRDCKKYFKKVLIKKIFCYFKSKKNLSKNI